VKLQFNLVLERQLFVLNILQKSGPALLKLANVSVKVSLERLEQIEQLGIKPVEETSLFKTIPNFILGRIL